MADLRIPGKAARSKPAWLAIVAAGATAAWMFARTLLPGLDLGDTASFQTLVAAPLLVPRHAYPLFFALGKLSVAALGGEPAHALNVFSAVAGAAAVAATAWLAWVVTGRAAAALWSGLVFAASYTLWSQAVIAEVYTLEAFFIAVVLGSAVQWCRAPATWRLAWLYALYAVSFGNHLSMILVAPSLVWLLWRGRSRAALDPFGLRGVALAGTIAFVGALQYAWNFAGLLALATPRPTIAHLLRTFWFDVTKSDWRVSLVGTVPSAQWDDRLAMYWWDLQQQFGLPGVAIAAIGVAGAVWSAPTVGAALVLAYAVTFAFAFLYNVGDTHVFLLPSHQVVAVFAACGIAALVTAADRLARHGRAVAATALFLIPLWRIADTWPAVDRSGDHRAQQYANALLHGLGPSTTVYLADLNWQVQNAVGYALNVQRPEIPRAVISQVLWHFPEFVRRNHELGRDILVTRPAADAIAAAYGSAFPLRPDPRLPTRRFGSLAVIPAGTPYVLVVMTALPELAYDQAEVAVVVRALAGVELTRARYTVIAGLSGSAPALHRTGARPFRATTTVGGLDVEVRIDAWLPSDTMRRAGFGHVIVNGSHRLTLERGANLGLFDRTGELSDSANQGGSFTPQPRYVIPVLR